MANATNWKAWFSFRGRAGRREYWRVLVALFAFGLLLQVAAAALPAILVVAFPISLACNVAQWAVIARRLHDLGRSGWWQVPATALGLMVLLRAFSLGLVDVQKPQPLPAELGAALLLMLAFFLAIGLVRGDRGPNRWGPPPA
jgi:uncharacterized membrane protein YhaH (DUF805 family)